LCSVIKEKCLKHVKQAKNVLGYSFLFLHTIYLPFYWIFHLGKVLFGEFCHGYGGTKKPLHFPTLRFKQTKPMTSPKSQIQHWFYDTSCLNMEIHWDKKIFTFSVIVKISMQERSVLTAFSFPGVLGKFAAFNIIFCLDSLMGSNHKFLLWLDSVVFVHIEEHYQFSQEISHFVFLFGTTWGLVSDDTNFNMGWTNPGEDV